MFGNTRPVLLFMVLLIAIAQAEESLRVLPEQLERTMPRALEQIRDVVVGTPAPVPDHIAPHDLVAQYLVERGDALVGAWEKEYETLEDVEAIRSYQASRRRFILDAIGGFPERTPLNPKLTGVVKREGYRAEKLLFESEPGRYVTALCFVPESPDYQPPYPGVVVPCGHYYESKAHDEYQSMGALLALSGMVGLVFDPIEQGERIQLPDAGLGNSVEAHNVTGPGSILVGRNTTRYYVYDGIRAIDYLLSRPDVQPGQAGVTGNSGGGTQTMFLASLDDRVAVAAPSCSVERMTPKLRAAGDVEQHVHAGLANGIDEPDFLFMRAPDVKYFLCTATQDFFDIHSTWWAYRFAKRIYTRFGVPEYMNILEEDVPHSYGKTQREAVARWMALWLRNEIRVIEEPKLELLTVAESNVTETGHVMDLDGAKTTYDYNEFYEDGLLTQRQRMWQERDAASLLADVRTLTGIRRLDELPPLKSVQTGVIERSGYRIEKLTLEPEPAMYLPALLFVPDDAQGAKRLLYLNDDGKAADAAPGGTIEQLVKDNHVVLAVDLRGSGETAAPNHTQLTYNFLRAYQIGRSLLGLRADDVLWCMRHLAEMEGAGTPGPVDVYATGNSGVAALHAAAFEPQLLAHLHLKNSLISYDSVVRTRIAHDPWQNLVQGALRLYDLPDLAGTLQDKLTIEEPFTAAGRPVGYEPETKQPTLLHRWSFNSESGTADMVGNADALLQGSATVHDGILDMTANRNDGDGTPTSAAWAELPIQETLKTMANGTFEIWFTPMTIREQAPLLTFGSEGNNRLAIVSDTGSYSRILVSAIIPGNSSYVYHSTPMASGMRHHLVVTVQSDAWTRAVALFIDGHPLDRDDTMALPAEVSYGTCLLGRSCKPQYVVPLWNGTIDEFRIYDAPLSFERIRTNFENGPDHPDEDR